MKQRNPQLFTKPLKPIAVLGLTLILGFLSACGSKKDAQSLVKAGSASSERLVKYYDSLVDANTKSLRALSYSTEIKLTKEQKEELGKERKAYASRADLARKLNATYVALGQLIDFDVAADIKGPVGDLITSVLKQVPHPGDLDSDLFKTVLTKIAGRLVEIQQEREFRKNAPRVLEVLDGIGEIFERERPLYVQTVQFYEDETSKLAQNFLGNGECGTAQVTGMGILEDLIEPYRVKFFLLPETNSKVCEKNREFVAEQIKELAHDRKASARNEARDISRSLYNLERLHRSFLHEKPSAPSLVQSDLADVSKLVATFRNALDARAAWEKQEQARKLEYAHRQAANSDNSAEGDKPEYHPENGAVAEYVATLLSPAVREAIEKNGDTSSNAFAKMLLTDLNRIIETGNVFEGILPKGDQETLEKYRNSSDPKERPGLRRTLVKSASDILVSDRTKFSTSPAEPPSGIKNLIAVDPVARPLAQLNRAIFAFVFANSIAP